jgi:hypothetical protein
MVPWFAARDTTRDTVSTSLPIFAGLNKIYEIKMIKAPIRIDLGKNITADRSVYGDAEVELQLRHTRYLVM